MNEINGLGEKRRESWNNILSSSVLSCCCASVIPGFQRFQEFRVRSAVGVIFCCFFEQWDVLWALCLSCHTAAKHRPRPDDALRPPSPKYRQNSGIFTLFRQFPEQNQVLTDSNRPGIDLERWNGIDLEVSIYDSFERYSSVPEQIPGGWNARMGLSRMLFKAPGSAGPLNSRLALSKIHDILHVSGWVDASC